MLTLKTCCKVSQRDCVEIWKYPVPEFHRNGRKCGLLCWTSQSNSLSEFSSQVQDCYILLPLHTSPIFYHRLIDSRGKIDLICIISPLFQEAFGKPYRPSIPAHCMCNFICPPSKCLSSSVLPDWVRQLKEQCKTCIFFSFYLGFSFEMSTHFTTSPGPSGFRLPF